MEHFMFRRADLHVGQAHVTQEGGASYSKEPGFDADTGRTI